MAEQQKPSGTNDQKNQQPFATAGKEREQLPNADPSRDPKTLNDFDPAYGQTHSLSEQSTGGVEQVDRESYGRGGEGGPSPETYPSRTGAGGGESGYGKQYGQGFGVGAGRGVQSGSQGLEGGSLEERDYRGKSGTTFGAPVGPDALKGDTREDEKRRPDPKPDRDDRKA